MSLELKPEHYDIFGYTGAVFLTLLTYPQVYHCFKNKTSSGLTGWFLFFEFMTSICFLIYGTLIEELPIMIANGAAFFGTILLIIAKILYKEKSKEEESN